MNNQGYIVSKSKSETYWTLWTYTKKSISSNLYNMGNIVRVKDCPDINDAINIVERERHIKVDLSFSDTHLEKNTLIFTTGEFRDMDMFQIPMCELKGLKNLRKYKKYPNSIFSRVLNGLLRQRGETVSDDLEEGFQYLSISIKSTNLRAVLGSTSGGSRVLISRSFIKETCVGEKFNVSGYIKKHNHKGSEINILTKVTIHSLSSKRSYNIA